ncbi:unnamed protein product [Calicophoron daubneyi]|uniref:Uncharacterized protein n=1 Tax=Calicophoron daubneyi TaxID=300641 RepID=A0AAV2TBI7_CALDB
MDMEECIKPVCYVWNEYALGIPPSKLCTMLANPQVRAMVAKTRCNVQVTKRILNRCETPSAWTRYCIIRISGPDEQSIAQCNHALERTVPAYQQRREYPRRAPVTLYSKNVEAGDFGKPLSTNDADAPLAKLFKECSSRRCASAEPGSRRSSSAREVISGCRSAEPTNSSTKGPINLDVVAELKITHEECSAIPPTLSCRTSSQVKIEISGSVSVEPQDTNCLTSQVSSHIDEAELKKQQSMDAMGTISRGGSQKISSEKLCLPRSSSVNSGCEVGSPRHLSSNLCEVVPEIKDDRQMPSKALITTQASFEGAGKPTEQCKPENQQTITQKMNDELGEFSATIENDVNFTAQQGIVQATLNVTASFASRDSSAFGQKISQNQN